MTTRNVRFIALGITVAVAALTGLITGSVTSDAGCDQQSTSEQRPQRTTEPPAAPSTTEDEAQDPDSIRKNRDNSRRDPEPGGPFTAEEADAASAGDHTEDCEESFYAPGGFLAFGGALLVGLLVTGIVGALPGSRRATTSPGIPIGAAPAGAPHPRTGHPRQANPRTGRAGVASSTGAFPVISAEPTDARAVEQRRQLIEALIYVRDRATSQAIADRVGDALRGVGVTELRPYDTTFDPAQHEAGGALTTDDPGKVGMIAGVEAVGYADGGVSIRPPIVTVYRSQQ